MKYRGPAPNDELPECIGVLLTNLGTPDSAAIGDIRRYLKEFLSDPRVVEMPRLLWWFALNGVILRTRPKRSAEAYRKVWTPEGSPLFTISRKQADALGLALNEKVDGPIKVSLAMRYGSPSIEEGLETLRQANAKRILILPLYPQYSATTTASTFDAVSRTLQSWRWIPELRFINHYHDMPDYIQALTQSVLSFQQSHGKPDQLLLSFHGIPQAYADDGDPYPQECKMTGALLAKELGLSEDEWALTFQSQVGPKEWLKPYTDETLKQWGSNGVKRVQVLCPGFPADCLETLGEIGEENRHYFLSAGGEEYLYIPALNDSKIHIDALKKLALQHLWDRS